MLNIKNADSVCIGRVLTFTSNFDSGNLLYVQQIPCLPPPLSLKPNSTAAMVANFSYNSNNRIDHEYRIWTRCDAEGSEFKNSNRTWFYFAVHNYLPRETIKLTVMNLNRQARLYTQGYAPFVRTVHPSSSSSKWLRIKDKPSWETVDGHFRLTFKHKFSEHSGGITLFAFCYPWSYKQMQQVLKAIDFRFQPVHHLNTMGNVVSGIPRQQHVKADSIYYYRELLCYSLEGNRIDLITISDHHGIQSTPEVRFDHRLFPTANDNLRCFAFKGKRVFVVTSRVHPGETPASFVFNGFLEFILRPNDPRAQQLRRQYVFKLVPILNPDGVVRGHYRTDGRGMNLNRVYLDPSFSQHPSIYAVKSLLVFHHVNNRLKLPKDEKHFVETAKKIAQQFADARSQERFNNSNKGRKWKTHRDSTTVPKTSKAVGKPYLTTASALLRQGKSLSNNSEELEKQVDVDFIQEYKTLLQAFQIPCKALPPSRSPQVITRETEKVSTADTPAAGDKVETPSESEKPVDLSQDSEYDIEDEFPSEHETYISESDLTGVKNSPHLFKPEFLDIPPSESGIAFYIDLHGHSSKRGCFLYGNYLTKEDQMIENVLYARLVACNSAAFDFQACNFTQRNMYMKDKRDGLSKEGSGRVAINKHLGIIHSYTLECNYNTGRTINMISRPYNGLNHRATPPPCINSSPRFTISHFEEVGRALAVGALDMTDTNVWSRVRTSQLKDIKKARETIRRYLRCYRVGLNISYPNSSFNKTKSQANNVSGLSSGAKQCSKRIRSPPRNDNTVTNYPVQHGNPALGDIATTVGSQKLMDMVEKMEMQKMEEEREREEKEEQMRKELEEKEEQEKQANVPNLIHRLMTRKRRVRKRNILPSEGYSPPVSMAHSLSIENLTYHNSHDPNHLLNLRPLITQLLPTAIIYDTSNFPKSMNVPPPPLKTRGQPMEPISFIDTLIQEMAQTSLNKKQRETAITEDETLVPVVFTPQYVDIESEQSRLVPQHIDIRDHNRTKFLYTDSSSNGGPIKVVKKLPFSPSYQAHNVAFVEENDFNTTVELELEGVGESSFDEHIKKTPSKNHLAPCVIGIAQPPRVTQQQQLLRTRTLSMPDYKFQPWKNVQPTCTVEFNEDTEQIGNRYNKLYNTSNSRPTKGDGLETNKVFVED